MRGYPAITTGHRHNDNQATWPPVEGIDRKDKDRASPPLLTAQNRVQVRQPNFTPAWIQ